MLHYIALSIALLLLLFNIYLRIAHPFWSIQPTFHIYDLHLWLLPNRIINDELPTINKFVKLLDAETFNIKNAPQDVIHKACSLVRSDYLRSKIVSYTPSDEDILTYLNTSEHASFLTVYSVPKYLNCEKGTIIDRDFQGVITSRPMHINFNDNAHTSLIVNYVDNMCVREDSRKQGIGQILIQTLHYSIRHLNKDIKVSLFKREGEMTAIVPLTSYITNGYYVLDIPTLRPERSSLHILRVTQQTFVSLSGFLKDISGDFDCILHPDKILMLKLITQGLLHVYMMIEDNEILSAYFFRNTTSTIDSMRGMECFAAIDKSPHKDTFFAGFCTAVRRASRKIGAQFLWIEQTSHACDLTSALDRHRVLIRTSCPNAFFLYNYAKYSNRPEKCLMIY
jgi:hypothetical protein